MMRSLLTWTHWSAATPFTAAARRHSSANSRAYQAKSAKKCSSSAQPEDPASRGAAWGSRGDCRSCRRHSPTHSETFFSHSDDYCLTLETCIEGIQGYVVLSRREVLHEIFAFYVRRGVRDRFARGVLHFYCNFSHWLTMDVENDARESCRLRLSYSSYHQGKNQQRCETNLLNFQHIFLLSCLCQMEVKK